MNRLEQLCTDRGLRMSEQRRAILQVIDEARDHPNVEEIYRRTLQKDGTTSLATVYRTINILSEAGILTRLELGDGKVRYEEASDDHHEHLVDVRSGAIVEFQKAGLEDLIRQAADALGYNLLDYRLEVFGEPHPSPDDPSGEGRPTAPQPLRLTKGAAMKTPSATPLLPSRPSVGTRAASRFNRDPRRKNHAHP